MRSAIYQGQIRHRRYAARRHEFNYPLFLMFLDLSELDQVFGGRWFWSTKRRAIARFDRADHFGDPRESLDHTVRNFVEQRTGERPQGRIRLLTHLRYCGYCFNPVSFYYVYRPDEAGLECIVAEVNNTPWGERHCYLLNDDLGTDLQGYSRYRSAKVMHVSPFMPMDLVYDWGFSFPADTLNVHMTLRDQHAEPDGSAAKVFDATLKLRRFPIHGWRLAWLLFRFPLMTGQVILAIHWEAFRLWCKRVPVHAHPAKSG